MICLQHRPSTNVEIDVGVAHIILVLIHGEKTSKFISFTKQLPEVTDLLNLQPYIVGHEGAGGRHITKYTNHCVKKICETRTTNPSPSYSALGLEPILNGRPIAIPGNHFRFLYS